MSARRQGMQTELGRELRNLREAAGLTAAEVASEFGWAESTITRKEKGEIRIKEADLERLLERYGVEQVQRNRLRQLAKVRPAATSSTRNSLRAEALPEVFQHYAELEEIATEISIYAAIVVPGLLQTPEYANAIIAATPLPEEDLARPRMDARMSRQGALARTPPDRLDVIIDEAVLLRPVGGAKVMRAQALRLVEMSERSYVTIRVLPLKIGAHPAVTGQFVLLRFADDKRPPVVFADGLTGGVLREETEAVQRYRACFAALSSLASSVEDSLALIQATAERFRG